MTCHHMEWKLGLYAKLLRLLVLEAGIHGCSAPPPKCPGAAAAGARSHSGLGEQGFATWAADSEKPHTLGAAFPDLQKEKSAVQAL